jgi:hypothetical protein
MVLHVRLKDGRIVKGIYVDRRGQIEGRIVGGQDGVTANVGFSEEEIDAVRREGFLSALHKWVERTD